MDDIEQDYWIYTRRRTGFLVSSFIDDKTYKEDKHLLIKQKKLQFKELGYRINWLGYISNGKNWVHVVDYNYKMYYNALWNHALASFTTHSFIKKKSVLLNIYKHRFVKGFLCKNGIAFVASPGTMTLISAKNKDINIPFKKSNTFGNILYDDGIIYEFYENNDLILDDVIANKNIEEIQ